MARWSETIKLASGDTAIVCFSGSRNKCVKCRRRATIQCDYPVETRSGTCDAYCCQGCATRVGANRDYCPVHAPRDAA